MSTPAFTPAAAAVRNCCEAYQRVLESERAKGTDRITARLRADEAYINAMPYLDDRFSIRDFVACVGQAMLLGIIGLERGSALLSAARTALAALREQTGNNKQSPKLTT
jgi:hypothetical protein